MSSRRARLASALVGIAALNACSDPPPPSGLDVRPSNPTCLAPARPPSTAQVAFERVYPAVVLATPLAMARHGARWFVAQRDGAIVAFAADGSTGAIPVASLPALAGLPVNQDGEGGLLGMAFHPQFATNGKLYVSWTTTGGGRSNMRSLVGVLHSPDGGTTFDSYATILGPFDQPAYNHNGGGVAFGLDGFLYLSFGDGGYPDPGQDPYRFHSKILRIDVDNVPVGSTYGIPPSNPFAAGGGEPATFARGFRNPYRFSIDRSTGEVWVGDVGQNRWEEINRVVLGGNYGWPCREGAHELLSEPPDCPDPSNLLDPIAEHAHVPENSRSITGGVVYRGSAIPAMVGSYVYGDYITQELFSLSFDRIDGSVSTAVIDGSPTAPWGSFAEDVDGEVYAVALNGAIYKMVPRTTAPTPTTFPMLLSQTGCVDPQAPTVPAPGLIPYSVNAPLWSDGATKERYLALPDGTTIGVEPDHGDFELPIGAVLVKTFALAGRPVETRLFVRHGDGDWAGYSYEWLPDQSDAVLLPASKTAVVEGQSWLFPSRGGCLRCHTSAAGRTLGLELRQLNGTFTYPTGRTTNQLHTLDRIGMFDSSYAAFGSIPSALRDPLGRSPLEARARSYLHANCSSCHRPGGGGRGTMDLRFTTDLADMDACDVAPVAGDLGIADARLLIPGDPEASLISVRAHLLGTHRMPPLASAVEDVDGLAVVDAWIRSLDECP